MTVTTDTSETINSDNRDTSVISDNIDNSVNSNNIINGDKNDNSDMNTNRTAKKSSYTKERIIVDYNLNHQRKLPLLAPKARSYILLKQ